MRLSSLTLKDLSKRLSGDGVAISIGGFSVELRSSLPQVANGVARLYADYQLCHVDEFVDFRIELVSPSLIRRWFRPQVTFSFDGHRPFKPLPIEQAFAMFEWGLNWVVANHAHQFAIIHAATVERNGKGVILPGAPGSGKSTLCAAMVCRGWRLLSDEMALLSLNDGLLWPIPRPVSLKNASIEIIQNFSKDAVFGEVVMDTAKGNVAHMRAPIASVDANGLSALPFAIVFPTYTAGSGTEFLSITKGRTLMRVAENCFNYPVLGEAGFSGIADAVERSECRTLIYSDMDQAIVALEQLCGP